MFRSTDLEVRLGVGAPARIRGANRIGALEMRYEIAMTNKRGAVVLGASGSVGGAVIAALVRDGTLAPIVSVVRRSQPAQVALARAAGVELREVLVPTMAPAELERATREASAGAAVGLSALGVGAGTGKLTIDDVELNAAFARGLAAAGVQHLAFLSAAGANPAAKTTGSGAAGMARYARVKGEAEEAVKRDGPPVVSVFRPGMIIGSQHTPWLLEKVLPVFSFATPKKYRSITVDTIARAMVATSRQPPATSAVYHYPEMTQLAAD